MEEAKKAEPEKSQRQRLTKAVRIQKIWPMVYAVYEHGMAVDDVE